MNIPNILTTVRFAIIPVFAYFLSKEQYAMAVMLFLLSGITDVLDGYIARKYDMITSWGKLADPLADKLIQITALVILVFNHKIPWVVLVLVALKEAFMGIGSIFLYKKQQYVVSANWYGKMATVVFYFMIVMIMILGLNSTYNTIFIGIALVMTLFAFIMYIRAFIDIRGTVK